MVKKIMAVLLSALLMLSVLSGCQKNTDETTEPASETASTESQAAEDTDASDASESTDVAEGSEAAAPSTLELTPELYCTGLLDNGFIDGVKASDYITLPDFTTISLSKEKVEPSEEDIQAQIDSLLSTLHTEVTDRAIEDGDRVNIDYSGKMDGEVFEGGTATGQDVTAGSNEFIDDFLTQIIGHKPGETMEVEVTFPDPYVNNPDFAGKDAVFTVTINYIHGIPEFTDELIKENSELISSYFYNDELETAEDVKNYIHDTFYEYNLNNELLNHLVENLTVTEIPEQVKEISKTRANIEFYRNYGMTVDDLLANGYIEEDEFEQGMEMDGKLYLLYQAIAEQEGWDNITEADVEELTGATDNEAVIAQYGMGYLANTLIYRRATSYMSDLVKVE